jgi:hypothetical protein
VHECPLIIDKARLGKIWQNQCEGTKTTP